MASDPTPVRSDVVREHSSLGRPRELVGRLPPLRRLRVRLTIWYVVTLGASQLALGAGLFRVIRHRYAADLDSSLLAATTEVIRAARIREVEAGARGPVVDAVDELHIPDRQLYLLDAEGRDRSTHRSDAWVRRAAAHASRVGHADAGLELPGERVLQLHAQRFTLRHGDTLVAVAVADQVELEHRYAALIAAFGGAALVALVLLAVGAWLLVRQSTRPIERAFAYMRRFMADAAHELRTPTTVLQSRVQVALQQRRDVDAYVDALQGIETETQRMARLIDDLLTLARADAGERPVERRALFLDDVVADAVDAAQALATRRTVALEIVEFEEAPVAGDPMLLRQLVMILLDNALKYTPRGGGVRVAVGRDGEWCTLRVSDTGVGIHRDQLPHVFERFYRGDPARTRDDTEVRTTSGAGLGLAIARWIAEVHDATIDVVSVPDRGTIVSVGLPASAPVSAVVSRRVASTDTTGATARRVEPPSVGMSAP